MINYQLIRELCKEKGISLKILAEAIGIKEPGLLKIIRTKSTKISTLEAIANELNVPVSYFFPDDPNATIFFSEFDRNMIEKDIEANGLSEYKYEILSVFNFVGTDIKGKFVDFDNKNSSLTKEGIINEIFIRYIMKLGHNKELDHMRKIIEDKEQIIEFLNDKLKSYKEQISKQ